MILNFFSLRGFVVFSALRAQEHMWAAFKTGEEALHGNVMQRRLAGPLGEQNRYAQIMLMLVPLGLFRFWGERSIALRQLSYAELPECMSPRLIWPVNYEITSRNLILKLNRNVGLRALRPIEAPLPTRAAETAAPQIPHSSFVVDASRVHATRLHRFLDSAFGLARNDRPSKLRPGWAAFLIPNS